MRTVIFVFIFISVTKCFGQDYFTAIAKSYTLIQNESKNKVAGIISITFSQEYSLLYIDGKGSITFTNEQYTRDVNNGFLHESYLSGETNTTPYGYYSIHLFRQQNNNIIEVVSRGVTYYAEHAQLYGENGKIENNPNIKNWKELIEKEKQNRLLIERKRLIIKDSLKREEIKDSLNLIRLDSIKKIEAENKLISGDNSIFIDANIVNSLNSEVESKVKLKNGENIYTNWKIWINVDGIIIDAKPDEKYKGGYLINSYIPEINNALINQKARPYTAKNGKNYPCYSFVYINLSYKPVQEKKRTKLKDALKMLPMGSFF